MVQDNREEESLAEAPQAELPEDQPEAIAEVAPTEEAPSAEAAPEAAPEVPTPPQIPIPSEADALRQQLRQQGEQIAAYQGQQREAAIQAESQRYQQQLVAGGVEPEQAQELLQPFQDAQQRAFDLQKQTEDQRLYYEGKMNATLFYSQQYGVPAKDLARYESVETMEQAAKDAARMAQLEKEITSLKKAEAPAQTFESGQTTVTQIQGYQDDLARYNSGERDSAAIAAGKRAAGQ